MNFVTDVCHLPGLAQIGVLQRIDLVVILGA
jgi:hypothetical protein